MQCSTMERNEPRPARPPGLEDEAGHRRLVRALVVACLIGGTWLAAQDVGLNALDTLLH